MKSAELSPLQVAYLLKDLSHLGFCLPPKIAAKLEANPPRELEAFTHAVFEAEGMDPDMADRPLNRQVRAVVAAAFERAAAHE